jgi:ABC-type multidrug transport system fused ATPase/permease subunit
MIKKYKELFKDILYVSKLTNVNRKKIRILLSVLLANTIVFSDIGIILVFASLLDSSAAESNFVVEYIKDNLYLLPLIVLGRFILIFIEKINLTTLEIEIQEKVKIHLIREMFEKSNYSIADAYYYINEVTGHIAYFYGGLSATINALLQMVVYTSYLIFTDIESVSTFGIGALILYLPTRYLLKLNRDYAHLNWVKAREFNFNISRLIDNMYLIKILQKTNEEIETTRLKIKEINTIGLKSGLFAILNSMIPNFFTVFIMSVLIVFFNFAKYLTLEFIGIVIRLFQTLGTFNTMLTRLINSKVHIEKLYELDSNKEASRSASYILEKNDKSENIITVKNVEFSYFSSEEILFQDLNLEFKRGEHVIITGPNGSGKSTLLGLLAGVLYPSKGSVTTATDQYGYIGVTPMIFEGTLKENLLYGNNSEITDEELQKMISEFKLFSEYKDIDLNKKVNNKSLSSGQMQKISFMRALLSKAKILLLDESTSNLDIETKNFIFEILNKQKITIINSTHNPEDFENVDRHLRIFMDGDLRKIKST